MVITAIVSTDQGRNVGMDHIISIEEKESGETSRGHDQPVIVAGDTHTLSKEEKF